MSLIALNQMLRRHRRHLAVLAAVAGMGAAVAVHHVSMDDMPMGMGDAAMVVCLAVLPVLAVATTRLGELWVGRLARLPRALVPTETPREAAPLPRARSSPVCTLVLRL